MIKNIIKSVFQTLVPARYSLKIYLFFKRGKLNKGSGTFIHDSVQIIGLDNVVLGENTVIGQDTWLNVNDRSNKDIAIEIGNNCFIGRRNFFTSGKKIEIGDYCLTAPECKFMSSTHIAIDPLQPYITTGNTNSDSIKIGTNVFFAANVTVLGNVDIGSGSVIGAGAMVRSDVPPFSLVVGNPARVIKRFSFLKRSWLSVNDLDPADLLENPTEEQYLNALKKNHVKIALPILASGNDMGSL